MSKIERILNGAPYTKLKPWDIECDFNVEDGKTFNTGKAFFEVFHKGFMVRGDADNLEDAEDIAWTKYQKIINCEHELTRINEFGLAHCSKCELKDNLLENISVCDEESCNKNHVGFVSGEKCCLNHYQEKLKRKLQSQIDSKECFETKTRITQKLITCQIISELGLVTLDSDHKEIELNFINNNRKVDKMILDLSEELSSEINNGNSIENFNLWNRDFDSFVDILKTKKDIIKMIITNENYEVIKSACRQHVF